MKEAQGEKKTDIEKSTPEKIGFRHKQRQTLKVKQREMGREKETNRETEGLRVETLPKASPVLDSAQSPIITLGLGPCARHLAEASSSRVGGTVGRLP